MIQVTLQAEYPEFNSRVRLRGQRFLARTPNPTSAQFKRHNYWSNAKDNLHAAYNGCCAYTSKYLVLTGSVDHFLPKSTHPHLAYEWDNYRLVRQQINSRKGSSQNITDPFQIQNGWYVLDMPSCLIRPSTTLAPQIISKINSTINILQLNSDDKLVQERCDLLVALADKEITLAYLGRTYPFLSNEVTRQGVLGNLKTIFSRI